MCSVSHFKIKDMCDLRVDMCLCVPPGSVGSQDSPALAKEEPLPPVQESSTKRLVVGPLEVRLHSSAVHRILKMVACAMDHEYEPYCKPEPGQNTHTHTHKYTHTHTCALFLWFRMVGSLFSPTARSIRGHRLLLDKPLSVERKKK